MKTKTQTKMTQKWLLLQNDKNAETTFLYSHGDILGPTLILDIDFIQYIKRLFCLFVWVCF